MTIAQAISAPSRGGSRWLLLGSLALNLFFVGIALALPQADAAILRGAMEANHAAIDAAQTKYHTARDHIHATLREDPFKIEDLRAAMAETRAARQAYDQVIQGVFADVAAKMSSAGRHAVADWRNSKTRSKNR
jgi:uncharacterized membrane protein